MRLETLGLAGLLIVAAWCAPAAARSPLSLEEVLQSSRQHAPEVQRALANVRVAQGQRLSADGAFDTVFNVDMGARLTGFYDGRLLSGTVSQPFETRGGGVYAGYRVSDGNFPIYEDQNFTNQLGELKVGAIFSLLRDRDIDERRFARTRADADIASAENDRLFVAIGVQQRAMAAYNFWVAEGLRLAIFKDLLAIARERQAGFERQVAKGLRPQILLVENEQTILRRETQVVQSERALAVAAAQLSLFLRDNDGNPTVPESVRLPEKLPPPVPIAPDGRELATQRPDLRAVDIRMRLASQRLALDRNSALPRLDLKVEASRDIGAIAEGGPSRSGTESKFALNFTVPLQQRAAEGRIAATQAEIQAFELRRRQIEDEIGVELGKLSVDVAATARVRLLAEQEQQRAVQLSVAERRRFQLGSSDLFLVTTREEAEADARIRSLEAVLRQNMAHAELAAAYADLVALGL